MKSFLVCRPSGLRLSAASAMGVMLIGVSTINTTPAVAQAVERLSLERAVDTAVQRSRLVTAAEAQARAASELAVAADRRPDPVLKLGVTNLPIDGPDRYSVTRDFMTMRSVGVMQEFTRIEKRQARAERARREVEGAQIGRQAVVADLQRDAALAWLDRSFRETMRELLRAQIDQAGLQLQAAETLYGSGKGAQADVFAARVSVEQLRDALEVADREVTVATTQLSRWVADEAQRPLSDRAELVLPAWTQGDFASHLERHPNIAAASQQEALAGSEAAVARAEKSADWSVELMVSQRGPAFSNMVSLNLSVPLQWDQRHRQDRELAARLAGVDQARARRDDVQRAHESEVRAMLQEWRSHGERLQRYDTSLLPLTEQRSESALAAYRAGSGPLTAILDARRGELDMRMERLRIEMQRARVWAQLNYLLSPGDSAQTARETTR